MRPRLKAELPSMEQPSGEDLSRVPVGLMASFDAWNSSFFHLACLGPRQPSAKMMSIGMPGIPGVSVSSASLAKQRKAFARGL